MTGDTLSDLLRAVRLRGAVYYYVEGIEPWVAEAPAAAVIAPAIMPGAEHLMEFHGVAHGACWAAREGAPPVRLEQGDLVLFPQGDAHAISSAPGMRAEKADVGFYFTPRPPQLPFALCMDGTGNPSALLDGGGDARTTVVCGFLGLDARPFNPLLASLPRMIHLPRAAAGPGSWIGQFLRSAVEESRARRPGGEALLERMSELMFVEALRRYVDTLPEEQTGWLAGMRDPAVGRVLALLHERPAEAWTPERLGEHAGMSRSVLHERFAHFVGAPPMQYLASWRMQLAAARLREGDDKVIDVALDVGYESEAAFSRAFKRATGKAPGAWRRAARVTGRSAAGENRLPAAR